MVGRVGVTGQYLMTDFKKQANIQMSPNDEEKAQTFKELEKKDQGQFCQILVCKTTMTPLGVIS